MVNNKSNKPDLNEKKVKEVTDDEVIKCASKIIEFCIYKKVTNLNGFEFYINDKLFTWNFEIREVLEDEKEIEDENNVKDNNNSSDDDNDLIEV